MIAADLLRLGKKALEPNPDAQWDARELLLHVLHRERSGLLAALQSEADEAQEKDYLLLISRRKSGVPLQYLLHEAWFMGLPFYVDERVLIPRQDTELLCEEALKTADAEHFSSVLDLCTGSGALAVSLGKLSALRVSAADISPAALSVARRNAEKNGVPVTFYEGDFLTPVKGRAFDLIVCNPPYLTQNDMNRLQDEVKKEPALALFGGADGLSFYRRLQREAANFLTENGILMMEIGWEQGKEVMALFSDWNPVLKQDMNGLDRVVIARRPKQ